MYLNLGKSENDRLLNYRTLFEAHLEQGLLNDIRESTNKGLALGNDRFKSQVESLTGRRVTPRKRGPKPQIEGDSTCQDGQGLLL